MLEVAAPSFTFASHVIVSFIVFLLIAILAKYFIVIGFK